jgi:hypothetical protein
MVLRPYHYRVNTATEQLRDMASLGWRNSEIRFRSQATWSLIFIQNLKETFQS